MFYKESAGLGAEIGAEIAENALNSGEAQQLNKKIDFFKSTKLFIFDMSLIVILLVVLMIIAVSEPLRGWEIGQNVVKNGGFENQGAHWNITTVGKESIGRISRAIPTLDIWPYAGYYMLIMGSNSSGEVIDARQAGIEWNKAPGSISMYLRVIGRKEIKGAIFYVVFGDYVFEIYSQELFGGKFAEYAQVTWPISGEKTPGKDLCIGAISPEKIWILVDNVELITRKECLPRENNGGEEKDKIITFLITIIAVMFIIIIFLAMVIIHLRKLDHNRAFTGNYGTFGDL